MACSRANLPLQLLSLPHSVFRVGDAPAFRFYIGSSTRILLLVIMALALIKRRVCYEEGCGVQQISVVYLAPAPKKGLYFIRTAQT